MSHTGHIDWHRLTRTPGMSTQPGAVSVFAYWLVDYGRTRRDHGVSLLKQEGTHPDWFINGDIADGIVFSVPAEVALASPNVTDVYDTHLTSQPLLGAICLGTASCVYARDEGQNLWWCAYTDLTRNGRRLVKDLSMLYLRPPVLITFVELLPMEQAEQADHPGAQDDQATVILPPGSAIRV